MIETSSPQEAAQSQQGVTIIDLGIVRRRALQDLVLLKALFPRLAPGGKHVVVLDDEWCRFLQRSILRLGYADCIAPGRSFVPSPPCIDLGRISCKPHHYLTAAARRLGVVIEDFVPAYHREMRDLQQSAELLRDNDIEPFEFVLADFSAVKSPQLVSAVGELARSGLQVVVLGPELGELDFGGSAVWSLTPPSQAWLAGVCEMAALVLLDDGSDLTYFAAMVDAPSLAINLSKARTTEYAPLPSARAIKAQQPGGVLSTVRATLRRVFEHNRRRALNMTMQTLGPDASTVMVVPGRKFNGDDQMRYVAVPSGIGDSLWAMTKVPSYRRKEKVQALTVCVCDCEPRRGARFLGMFDFVDRAAYVRFPLHPRNEPELKPDGSYNYLPTQKNFRGMDWLWTPNEPLEQGRRLETWLPEFDTDFEICKNNLVIPKDNIGIADRIRASIPGPYAVFFLGNRRSNVDDGHNRGALWSLHDWLQLGDLVRQRGCHIVVVGAPYDLDYATDLRQCLKRRQDFWHILVGGTTIGVTLDLCRTAECVISYQCGIGMVSVYMGVPAVLWWRPYGNSTSPNEKIYISFNESMSHAWAPPYCIGTQYLPQIYQKCTARTIIEDIERAGWFEPDGPHYPKLLTAGKLGSPEEFAAYCYQRKSLCRYVAPPPPSY